MWKWLTAFLAGAMLAGAPSYGVLLSKPSSAQIDRVNEQINSLQIQQARMSEQIIVLQEQLARLLIGPQ